MEPRAHEDITRPARSLLPDGFWTKERIVAALQEYYERYGEISAQALNVAMAKRKNRDDLVERFYAHRYPHYGTVVKEFATWSAALRAAGLPTRSIGERRR